MSIKRNTVILSIFIVFIIVAIGLFSLWPRQPSQTYKYNIIVDDALNGNARSPVVLHATIKSDSSWSTPGWDTDNDGAIDLNATPLCATNFFLHRYNYRSYQPWKEDATSNEKRYYAYVQFNQSGNYILMFMLHGVDGWLKKQVNVSVAEPMIHLTVTPIKTPFNSGDNIIFHATVKNEGPFSIWINYPCFWPGNVDAQIIIPNGTMVEKYDPVHPGPGQIQQREVGYELLDPGETFSIDDENVSFNLTYGSIFFGNSSLGFYEYKFNDIGTFEVKLEYYFGISGTLNLGKSDSSIFYTEFQVV